jgi:hypothetical protein
MISIAAPAATMALDVRLSEELGKEYFAVEVTLMGAPTLPKSPKPLEGSGEPRSPECVADSDAYGENGERMPYYPARRREFPGARSEILSCNSGRDFHPISCFFACRSRVAARSSAPSHAVVREQSVKQSITEMRPDKRQHKRCEMVGDNSLTGRQCCRP